MSKNLYATALNKAMELCSRKEYCNSDIRLKLTSWGIDEKDTDKILNFLTKEKFLDEKRYAAAYARDKFTYNKWGRIKIASNLKMKKISPVNISSALNSIDPDQYSGTLRIIIESHKKNVRSKNPYELKAKLMRFGLSKGFESYLLYDILGENID